MDNGFMELVAKYGGFEYILGFRDDEDHFIGGSGNRVWYFLPQGPSPLHIPQPPPPSQPPPPPLCFPPQTP
ncbi:MAG: hypothetical protein CW338_12190, partial [Clostridiales bacterium]|nr:hypothetical protein [Clostridiales bacterium]